MEFVQGDPLQSSSLSCRGLSVPVPGAERQGAKPSDLADSGEGSTQ